MAEREHTGPYSRPPSTAHLNDLELRMRAVERHVERASGSMTVTKWIASAVLGVALTAAVGVWRSVVVSETKLDHFSSDAIKQRQDIAALDTRLDALATVDLRLAALRESNADLAAKLDGHMRTKRAEAHPR